MSEDYTLGTYSKLVEAAEKKLQPVSPAPEPETTDIEQAAKAVTGKPAVNPRNHDTVVSRHRDTKSPTKRPAPSVDADVDEEIRKAVKQLGEKAATHRFTVAEKDALTDIVFGWKKKGISTSENEITRIAINYILLDYRKNKNDSIVSRVLERLNS